MRKCALNLILVFVMTVQMGCAIRFRSPATTASSSQAAIDTSELEGTWHSECLDMGGAYAKIFLQFANSRITNTLVTFEATDTTCADKPITIVVTSNTYSIVHNQSSSVGNQKVFAVDFAFAAEYRVGYTDPVIGGLSFDCPDADFYKGIPVSITRSACGGVDPLFEPGDIDYGRLRITDLGSGNFLGEFADRDADPAYDGTTPGKRPIQFSPITFNKDPDNYLHQFAGVLDFKGTLDCDSVGDYRARAKIIIAGDYQIYTDQFYLIADTNCSGPIQGTSSSLFNINGSSLGAISGNVYRIDTELKEDYILPLTNGFTTWLEAGACTSEDLTTGQSFHSLGLCAGAPEGEMYYSVLSVTNDNVYGGDASADVNFDGTTANKRPQVLMTSPYFDWGY